MITTASQFDDKSRPSLTAPCVVVVYEDIISGQLGREIARQFAGERAGGEIAVAAWNAALLDDEYFSDFIAAQLADAEMIVVAIRGADGLTRSLKRWIHRWTVQDRHQLRPVVIVLEESDSPPSARVPAFIKDTARRAGMEFFRQKGDAWLTDESPATHESLWLI